MSSYPYSLLPADGENIRLLRLLPSEDEAAPLRCELQNYSLRRSTSRTHLYEALSYVWGDLNNSLLISVDKKQFQVTVNLYAALLHLRDHSFERIIWIDAICIDQNNNGERTQQVQLMAKIYSSANRVIVWLGEEIEEVKGALEGIQLAVDEEYTENSEIRREMLKPKKLIKLLHNPWFQRIWVLQEVAAARHIIIMCGSKTIDGYAFCMGVKFLELPYKHFPGLQTLPSVVDIIERAGLRAKLRANLPERFSLEIRSLAELIDMFHTRQATDRRDKVYALLGMCSDDPEKAGLQPNYEISWEDIFQQVVQFILGKYVSVKTSSERVVIQCKGVILGRVSSVKRDDRQHVTIDVGRMVRGFGDTLEWTVQASANPIRTRDIICLLYGASKPSIIRLCKDHFAVVVIAATPLNKVNPPAFYGTSPVDWPQVSQSKIRLVRNLLLVWDWGNSYRNSQDKREHKTLTKTFSQASMFSKAERVGYLEKATRLWNDIAILDDLKEYKEADERLIAAQDEYYLAVVGKTPSSHEPENEYCRTILAFAAAKGHEDIVKLLLDTIYPDIEDGRRGYTPLLLALQNRHEAIVKLLVATGQPDTELVDDLHRSLLSRASADGNEATVELLLATEQVEINSKDSSHRTPLSRAAMNGHEAVVTLLLATGQAEVDCKDDFGSTPLASAAEHGHEAIVKLLLATDQVQADSKDNYRETPLYRAAKNGHEAVVKLLLATGKVEVDCRNLNDQSPIWWAAKKGHKAVVKLLLATGQVKASSNTRYDWR
ncbi:hypothetical protein EAF00_010444 [Botryotinia globosa]|nr:hypothetical protein EAF00_010444 [Botryotinia globosa]